MNSDRKEIIIHAGLHKTATSTIQHGLSNNAEMLAEYGYVYPKFDLLKSRGSYAHNRMMVDLFYSEPSCFQQHVCNPVNEQTQRKIREYFLVKIDEYLSLDKSYTDNLREFQSVSPNDFQLIWQPHVLWAI